MKGPVTMTDNSPNPPEDARTSTTTSDKEVDFSEYMWMGEVELEDFDRKVEEELLEQEFIDQCFEDMENNHVVEEEEEGEWFYAADYENWLLTKGLNNINLNHQPQVQYQLNPNAPEFVPSSMQQLSVHSQEQER